MNKNTKQPEMEEPTDVDFRLYQEMYLFAIGYNRRDIAKMNATQRINAIANPATLKDEDRGKAIPVAIFRLQRGKRPTSDSVGMNTKTTKYKETADYKYLRDYDLSLLEKASRQHPDHYRHASQTSNDLPVVDGVRITRQKYRPVSL